MKVNLTIICSPRNTSKWRPQTKKRQYFKPDFQYVVRPFDVTILTSWQLYMNKLNQRIFSSVTQIRIPCFCAFDFSFVSNRFSGIKILFECTSFSSSILNFWLSFQSANLMNATETRSPTEISFLTPQFNFPIWCGFVSCEQRRI